MPSILRQRADIAANWTANNPVIPNKQLCFDVTNNTFRIGDGTNNYADLPIQSGPPGADGTLTGLLGSDLDCNGHQILTSSYPQAPDQATGVINYALGDMVEITAAGDLTLSFTGFVAGNVCAMIVDVVNFGDWTISYPVGTEFSAATAPTFTAGGRDRLLITKDSADVYTITVIAQAISVVI